MKIVEDVSKNINNNQTNKIAALKRDLEEKSKDDKIKFQKKGNEKMFQHSKEVLKKVDESLDMLENNDLEKVKETLEEGKKLLKKRLKLIRLADREDWLKRIFN